jgi:hypothetical protein
MFGSRTEAELMLRGGFPELYDKPELDGLDFCRSYVTTYLERDLRLVLRVHQLRDFERFIRACALRSGQLVNKAELARDVGVSAPTANEWLSALAATNHIHLLEPYFNNRTRSLVKTPKLYLTDTGLLCFLLGIRSVEDLLASPLLGAVWETFVAGELRKKLELTAGASQLFFWRDRQREVDFVIPRGGRFVLFEAKWTASPSTDDSRSLRETSALLGARNVMQATLLCRSPTPSTLADGTKVRGLKMWAASETL